VAPLVPFLLFFALVGLLALNAFFVLAEFAVVKVRPSRVTQLVEAGDPRARLLREIQSKLDEYLSVCQVGITVASVALGMVGEKASELLVLGASPSSLRTFGAGVASFLLVSCSHVLLGELVPKSVAIRVADHAAVGCAVPLRVAHWVFFPALWLLTHASNAILALFGLVGPPTEHHSEKELRIILDESQERGVMSFRRLLFMENVFDFGELTVGDAMRTRAQVKTLSASCSWQENLETIRGSHFTRYPLVTSDPERPTGFVHVKDLIIRGDAGEPDLVKLARPLLATTEATKLEALFSEMQRRRIHVALVTNRLDRWSGIVTLEDVIEELVGTIRDEFEDEDPVRLGDALNAQRIHFNVEAESPLEAVRIAFERMGDGALPMSSELILQAIEAREHQVSTYLGHGVAMPHARLNGLQKPVVLILRSERGIAYEGTSERGRLLFVLLTPAGQPRVHQRLQFLIVALVHESEYVKERLLTADSVEEVLEVIRTGEQAAID
jgi:CBS domain containing-hemolysin-like protein